MIKLNHLSLVVSNCRKSHEWYVNILGLRPEFELPDRRVAAVQDDAKCTLILVESRRDIATTASTFAYEVDDADATHEAMAARGVRLVIPFSEMMGL